MSEPLRPRRSLLWTPADRIERWTKGLGGPADIMGADLEDGVAPANKEQARAAIVAALEGSAPGRTERLVRINAWPTALGRADLEAVAPLHPELIAVPKVEQVDHVRQVAQLLDRCSSSSRLLLMLETSTGVLQAEHLLAASPRVGAVAFGAEDYAADVGAVRSSSSLEVLFARSRVVAAAATVHIDAIDQVFVALDAPEELAADARFGASLGYRGKQLIHPKQVPIVHAAMRPTPAAVRWAAEVIAAVELQGTGEGGVVVVQQRMVDRPLIAQARRILLLHSLEPASGDSS